MNLKVYAAVALALGATASHACDCTLYKNRSQPECKGSSNTQPVSPVPSPINQSIGVGATSSATQSQNQLQQAQGGNAAGGAGGSGGQGGSGGAGGSSTNKINTTASGGASASRSNSGSVSAATGGDVSGVTSSSGPSTSTISSTSTNSGNTIVQRPPVETAVAGFQETTAMCWHAEGLGVQGVGAAGSVGFTFKDQDCIRYTVAHGMYARGQIQAANMLMCDIKAVHKSLGKDCMYLVSDIYAPPATIEVTRQTPGTYTQEQVDAIVKKMLRK